MYAQFLALRFILRNVPYILLSEVYLNDYYYDTLLELFIKDSIVMGVGSGPWPHSWIFIHGKDIVDRGLIVLFFGLKRLNSAIFGMFYLCLLEIFLSTPLSIVRGKWGCPVRSFCGQGEFQMRTSALFRIELRIFRN